METAKRSRLNTDCSSLLETIFTHILYEFLFHKNWTHHRNSSLFNDYWGCWRLLGTYYWGRN